MLSLLLAPIITKIKDSVIVRKSVFVIICLSLIAGGFLYARHQKNKIIALQTQVQELEKAKHIYEHDLKVNEETQNEKDKIDSLGPDDMDGMYRMLRERSQRKNGTTSQGDN